MLLNSLILPLTGLTTIKALIKALNEKDMINWPAYLSGELLTTYNYFITYFIQLTFLSVGFWLLDLPHHLVKTIAKTFHDFQERNKITKKPFVDRYAFDLGYHSAYGLATFAIMLLFSSVVPYVPIFAGIFFVFKYCVDKYNLSFVYNSEFRGLGIIYKRVMQLCTFIIFLFQLINIGFFTTKSPSERKDLLFWICNAFVFFELIIFFLVSARLKSIKRRKHIEMRKRESMLAKAE